MNPGQTSLAAKTVTQDLTALGEKSLGFGGAPGSR